MSVAAFAGPLPVAGPPRARRQAAAWGLWLLAAGLVALCACEQGPRRRQPLPLKSYVRFLESKDRLAYKALETDEARRTFLTEHGAFIRHRLSKQLSAGQTKDQAEASLGPPYERETEWAATGELEWWTYPTQDNAFQILLQFRADRLVSWEVIGGPR